METWQPKLQCIMIILLCRKVRLNFSMKLWTNGAFSKLSNCTGDRLRQHHMKIHPKIEKYLYNCKICSEYPPTISFMAIMEHYKKVKFVKKWVVKSPKLLFTFANISHRSWWYRGSPKMYDITSFSFNNTTSKMRSNLQ